MQRKYKFNEKTQDKIFFTADCHFSHANILKFEKDSRPFNSVHEMNKALTDNWNNVVPNNGFVFIVGDFSFNKNIDNIVSNLNGKKIFIRGNHDYFPGASELPDRIMVSVEDKDFSGKYCHIICDHFPMMSWDRSFHGSFQVFGHVHSKYIGLNGRLHYNVGVDVNDLAPVSYPKLKNILLLEKEKIKNQSEKDRM